MLCRSGYYLSECFLGKGMIWDVSSGGWRIQGDHRVMVGMTLILRVDLAEARLPLEVEQATVQWVCGLNFGIRIDKIGKQSAGKLERLIGAHLQSPYPVGR
jgi:hypothetical protein